MNHHEILIGHGEYPNVLYCCPCCNAGWLCGQNIGSTLKNNEKAIYKCGGYVIYLEAIHGVLVFCNSVVDNKKKYLIKGLQIEL